MNPTQAEIEDRAIGEKITVDDLPERWEIHHRPYKIDDGNYVLDTYAGEKEGKDPIAIIAVTKADNTWEIEVQDWSADRQPLPVTELDRFNSATAAYKQAIEYTHEYAIETDSDSEPDSNESTQ